MPHPITLGGYEAKTCVEATRKNYDPAYADAVRDPIPPGDLARMESGVLFEQVVGENWKRELGRKLACVPSLTRSKKDKKERERITADFMSQGKAHVIWNARLAPQKSTHRTGEPDALVRAESSTAKSPRWYPVDVKDHKCLEGTANEKEWPVSTLAHPRHGEATPTKIGVGTLRKADALQLAHYHRMLEALGMAADPVGGIIGREGVIVWHRLDVPLYRHTELGLVSALDYYDHEFSRRVEVAKAALEGEALSHPEWKSECSSCQWHTTCHDELSMEMDHITLISGVTPARAKAHYERNVTKRSQLVRLSWKAARVVDAGIDGIDLHEKARRSDKNTPVGNLISLNDSQKAVLKEIGVHTAEDAASLHRKTLEYSGSKVWNLPGVIDQARVAMAKKVHRARGVGKVSLQRVSIEQDIDIEDDNGYVYLIGVRDTGRKKDRNHLEGRAEIYSFVTWDKTPEGEARVFAEFWQHVSAMRAKAKARGWGYRAYHYTHHEVNAFRGLAARHAGMPGVPTSAELEEFLSTSFIDLYPILSQELIWPTETNTLKDLAKWARFSWRDTDPGGGNSLAWYAIATSDSDQAEEYRQRLLEYNADDCEAQVAIRDWLSRLAEGRSLGKSIPSVDVLDKRYCRS